MEENNVTVNQNGTSPLKQQDNIFKLTQKLLKNPPLIIWGSGATIPYGLPSMDDLKKQLEPELGVLNSEHNLEEELGKIDNSEKIIKIKEVIKNIVFKKDLECLKKSVEDVNYFKAIEKMINKFYKPHPHKVDIVTTNYDCILEYALSKSGHNFTDGFTGRSLSEFGLNLFKDKEIINLIKVHGSLNWYIDENDNVFYLPFGYHFKQLKYAMVPPAQGDKYIEAFKEPYRSLISKADQLIQNANSFLVIGFGFNDEHLTPKIEHKIKKGTPIVVVTRKITISCTQKLQSAIKYCIFEECNDQSNQTKVTYKNTEETINNAYLENKYWQLDKFMEIL